MMKFLFTIVIVCICFWVYVRFIEATTLFIPSKKILATPKDNGMPFEDVYFKAQDGVKLNGWFISPSESTALNLTVLFFHGNAGNIGDRLSKIETFIRQGLNVFIVDYRGFGNSQGNPTEKGMYSDALGAYHYLTKERNIKSDKIIIYGVSLGGVAAVNLASTQPVAAVILDSTFTSAVDMAKEIVPFIPSFMLNLKLDSINKIKNVTAPKLFIHSSEDETVPIRLGQKLFQAALDPKEFLTIKGSHNEGYFDSQSDFYAGVFKFLQKYKLN